MQFLKFLLIGLGALSAIAASPAQAQAPTEERRHRADSYADAQQRVEFARKASEQSELELPNREKEFQDADNAMKAAQKQFDEARARREKARKDFSDAASRSTEAKRTFDREAAAFERLRKGEAAPKAKK